MIHSMHNFKQRLKTMIWNARFQAGYKIGGFTSAKRSH